MGMDHEEESEIISASGTRDKIGSHPRQKTEEAVI
jgi:hypothetical protein